MGAAYLEHLPGEETPDETGQPRLQHYASSGKIGDSDL